MHCLVSGSILIHPPSDSLHINTELSHVHSLAWLLYIYLPLYSEKAPLAKPHCLLPSSRETLHKLGKILSLFLDTVLRTRSTFPLCCYSIPKVMLDNIKTLCYIPIYLILSETLLFFCSSSILFWILFKYIPKTHLHFNCRIWLVWTIHKSFCRFPNLF